VTGFLTKLDVVEQKLKESQDKIDKELEEEARRQYMKEQLESQMTEAIYAINDVDREGLSRSSGGQTTTTRDSDSDFDGASFSKSSRRLTTKQKHIKRAQEAKKAYEEITFNVNVDAESGNPRLFNSVVNHISDVDLDNASPTRLDGEHFLIKVNVTVPEEG